MGQRMLGVQMYVLCLLLWGGGTEVGRLLVGFKMKQLFKLEELSLIVCFVDQKEKTLAKIRYFLYVVTHSFPCSVAGMLIFSFLFVTCSFLVIIPSYYTLRIMLRKGSRLR